MAKNADIIFTMGTTTATGSARCRHCGHLYSYTEGCRWLKHDKAGNWFALMPTCPGCGNINLAIGIYTAVAGPPGQQYPQGQVVKTIYLPERAARLCPPEVPSEFASDFRESAQVLDISPAASAALSRRCLQHVLRDKAGFAQNNLVDQIKAATASNTLPSYITDDLDAVRMIGNFAAHPMKDTTSGEIVEVEEGEADWNLDVLESLFEFYFVGPAQRDARKNALNTKLSAAGKPPIP